VKRGIGWAVTLKRWLVKTSRGNQFQGRQAGAEGVKIGRLGIKDFLGEAAARSGIDEVVKMQFRISASAVPAPLARHPAPRGLRRVTHAPGGAAISIGWCASATLIPLHSAGLCVRAASKLFSCLIGIALAPRSRHSLTA
jgi:hypothetical protein